MIPDVAWHPFDPQEPGSPHPSLDGNGAVAVVPAGDPEWAASAVVGLARSLARNGRRVFLCDAEIEDPRLQHFFEGEFGEGVTDLVLYGASPRRVARQVEERLLFVPAGTAVADAGRVRSSPRWDALVDAVAQADGVLLLYLPASAEGADALLARAERVVIAGTPDAAPALGEASDRLVAGLHPSGYGPGTGGAAHEPVPAPGPGGTPEVHLASGSDVETPATAEGELLDDPRIQEAVARARRSDGKTDAGGTTRLLLILLLVVVLAALAAAWFGVISIPGITPADAGTTPAPASSAEAPSPSPDQEVRVVAPHHVWNLTVGSYADPGAAAALAGGIGEAHPGLSLAVAPVEIEGTVYHRVLAGPMPDSVEAAALRARLVTEVPGAGDGVVRAAPLAFVAGETAERGAALRRRQVLAELGIPAHVLALARSDGTTLYRVYVGAYADAEEAAWMAARLTDRNVMNAPLSPRLGTPPA